MQVIGIALGVALLVVAAPRAAAYPQYQLSRDQTCTSCHVSPAGGGLLTENGYNVAEREHYVTWQQQEGTGQGLFVRAGRFMPVFGLRFAEHPDYNRQYGGTPLYADTYAAAVEYIMPTWEAHL